jgi:hypothetical protein
VYNATTVGFQGYYDQQLSGSSGARLGDFKGESVGLGLALLWLPEFGKGKLRVIGKGLHGLEADYGLIISGYND